ncbi:[FeFe] hydrogenase H-cluster radical SAM maturase HydE [Clostridium sp. C8-1-8]|uniref:[FeFe] hydrogenase H-cluster radical SAM maturase HydE n=1 Tax=Clostridium sp. C8-1-8 TaxID=2698831 RepID=UPI00136B5103|nr:[FeFe] hydrogenase H-cluster radical SAM maturase HydE [Clostridium sp. C8-1-8]
MDKLIDLVKKAKTTHCLTKDELVELLKNDEINETIYKAADEVREEYRGNEVLLRGLIEFTNICKRNCMYCGLRRDNKNIERYRLSEEEILDFATKAVGYGYKNLVLQGGEDDYFTIERMSNIIRKIKALGVTLTISIGEKTYEEYKALKEAGADRYLLRIETTDEDLYHELDPGMSHAERKRCLRDLKSLGYEVGCGSLVGLPNQTIESIADDILFFKGIDANMIGIGPFIPNGDTPLAACAGGDFHMSIKVMALTRLLMPGIRITATTAMETLNKNGRVIALESGANVVMPNVTEGDYRRLYALYPGKICINDTPAHCRGCISGKIKALGRTVSDISNDASILTIANNNIASN